jgi:hypothetical protein
VYRYTSEFEDYVEETFASAMTLADEFSEQTGKQIEITYTNGEFVVIEDGINILVADSMDDVSDFVYNRYEAQP